MEEILLSKHLEGGCLCNGIRYEISGEPFGVFHCHCSICRRAGAGAFVAWVGVAASDARITKGEVKVHASSEDGRRGFCPTCGAQISFVFESNPESIYLTAATLDDAEEVSPTDHGYVSETVRWLHIDDDLPQHDGNPPVIEQVMK